MYNLKESNLVILKITRFTVGAQRLEAKFLSICIKPEALPPEADLRSRPSIHTHNRDLERSSCQATQFNNGTI